ncbi:TPA: hypothetical protein DD449_04325 [Candidatus Berkelbacteria bacterium]|uniref:Uncharacterized protein n=1 Tax=Berkelbacteria bacterium GW2011_GWE1_39_12 TaxID=1618337 RepID=A0A0G4B406_9BACT|nr:MAG: hypothetical protein UT28_C0001G0485 [Berkelbacteria bacterium GW2011_GWE1_39_12]HBO60881.1 hypothetical protein [Candidatus Berkelbacteria bacterium]
MKFRVTLVVLAIIMASLLVSPVLAGEMFNVGTVPSNDDGCVVDGQAQSAYTYTKPVTVEAPRAPVMSQSQSQSVTVNSPTKIVYRTKTVRAAQTKRYYHAPAKKPATKTVTVVKTVEKEKPVDPIWGIYALYGLLGALGIVALVALVAMGGRAAESRRDRRDAERAAAEAERARRDVAIEADRAAAAVAAEAERVRQANAAAAEIERADRIARETAAADAERARNDRLDAAAIEAARLRDENAGRAFDCMKQFGPTAGRNVTVDCSHNAEGFKMVCSSNGDPVDPNQQATTQQEQQPARPINLTVQEFQELMRINATTM